MIAVSRRKFLSVSSTAALISIGSGTAGSSTLLTQASDEGASSTVPNTTELVGYVTDSAARLLTKMRRQGAKPEHYKEFSARLHLAARHFSENYDSDISSRLNSPEAKAEFIAKLKGIDFSNPSFVQPSIDFLQKYDPTISISAFPTITPTDDDLHKVVSEIASNGISGYFHQAGELLNTAAGLSANGQEPSGHYVPSLYSPKSRRAHVQNVCLITKQQKDAICSLGTMFLAIAVATLTIECATLLLVFCVPLLAYLGGSMWAVLQALLAIWCAS